MAVVTKLAVTLPMSDCVRLLLPYGRGAHRPHCPRILVPQIDYFSGRIGNRVIGPGGQLIFSAVFRKDKSPSPLADNTAKIRIGQDIEPGGRGHALLQPDNIFSALRAKAAEAVVI